MFSFSFNNKIIEEYLREWVSEWVLLNAKSAIFQLYHGQNKLIFQWDDDKVRFVLNQHAKLDFYSASSLKQQSVDRRLTPLGHIFLIPS